MPKLGATYYDLITGFEGVAIGYVQYITGCNQVLLAPRAIDGAMKESQWIDEQRLTVNEDVAVIAIDNGRAAGFDRAPPRR
ncbi:hypothetical protein [Shinella sp. BYT-45]|uniref:hypothetical protein n=1 Tax=Shinella sp. BYT-45 TaxID=3377377 RepID=UPI00397FC047